MADDWGIFHEASLKIESKEDDVSTPKTPEASSPQSSVSFSLLLSISLPFSFLSLTITTNYNKQKTPKSDKPEIPPRPEIHQS